MTTVCIPAPPMFSNRRPKRYAVLDSPRDLWLCVLPRWQFNVNVYPTPHAKIVTNSKMDSLWAEMKVVEQIE